MAESTFSGQRTFANMAKDVFSRVSGAVSGFVSGIRSGVAATQVPDGGQGVAGGGAPDTNGPSWVERHRELVEQYGDRFGPRTGAGGYQPGSEPDLDSLYGFGRDFGRRVVDVAAGVRDRVLHSFDNVRGNFPAYVTNLKEWFDNSAFNEPDVRNEARAAGLHPLEYKAGLAGMGVGEYTCRRAFTQACVSPLMLFRDPETVVAKASAYAESVCESGIDYLSGLHGCTPERYVQVADRNIEGALGDLYGSRNRELEDWGIAADEDGMDFATEHVASYAEPVADDVEVADATYDDVSDEPEAAASRDGILAPCRRIQPDPFDPTGRLSVDAVVRGRVVPLSVAVDDLELGTGAGTFVVPADAGIRFRGTDGTTHECTAREAYGTGGEHSLLDSVEGGPNWSYERFADVGYMSVPYEYADFDMARGQVRDLHMDVDGHDVTMTFGGTGSGRHLDGDQLFLSTDKTHDITLSGDLWDAPVHMSRADDLVSYGRSDSIVSASYRADGSRPFENGVTVEASHVQRDPKAPSGRYLVDFEVSGHPVTMSVDRFDVKRDPSDPDRLVLRDDAKPTFSGPLFDRPMTLGVSTAFDASDLKSLYVRADVADVIAEERAEAESAGVAKDDLESDKSLTPVGSGSSGPKHLARESGLEA